MAGDTGFDDLAGLAPVDRREREILRTAEPFALDQDTLACTGKCSQVAGVGRVSGGTQPRGALFDYAAINLRHAGGRRAFAW